MLGWGEAGFLAVHLCSVDSYSRQGIEALCNSCIPEPCHLLQTAQESLQSAAEAVGLRLKLLDKKAEKALAQAQQDDLKAQLADQTDPAAVLSLVVPLLVMQVRACPGHTSAVCDCDDTVSHLFEGALQRSPHSTTPGRVKTILETFCWLIQVNWRLFCCSQEGSAHQAL